MKKAKTSATTPSAVSQLCPQCGLCCNGVLFGDVELLPRDDARRLAKLGLKIFSKDKKKAFRQPCSCFDGVNCRIYADRPSRCRSFECRLLQRVDAGRITSGQAVKTIKMMRRYLDTVQGLVREFGQTDERVPLNQRYGAVIAQPIDLADEDANLGRRSELMHSVGKLVLMLERDFLT